MYTVYVINVNKLRSERVEIIKVSLTRLFFSLVNFTTDKNVKQEHINYPPALLLSIFLNNFK